MIVWDDWQKEILETKGNIVLCSGRQVGKSSIIAKKAGDFAVNNFRKSVLIISATERQAEELFIKVLNYLEENHKQIIKAGKERPTKHALRLRNGSIIRCLPTGLAGTGIRGFTIDLLIEDESAFINDEVQLAVSPMLLTTGGDIILVSTPHGKTGYFWRCYNDPSFKVFHIKSEEVITNRQISATWTKIQKEKALEHLDRERRSMSANEFAQEYGGMFIDELSQFFPDELIKKCMTRKRSNFYPRADYFLGIDVSRLGEDETTFEIIDRTDRHHLIHVESIVKSRHYLNEIYNQVLELDLKYKFKKIYIDDAGLGVGVFDYLLENPQTKRKVVPINNRSRPLDKDDKHKKKILKEDLYNNLRGLMERGEIELLEDEEIFQSLKSVQYEYITKEKTITKFRIFGQKTHITEGLIRAVWCNRDKSLNLWVR